MYQCKPSIDPNIRDKNKDLPAASLAQKTLENDREGARRTKVGPSKSSERQIHTQL